MGCFLLGASYNPVTDTHKNQTAFTLRDIHKSLALYLKGRTHVRPQHMLKTLSLYNALHGSKEVVFTVLRTATNPWKDFNIYIYIWYDMIHGIYDMIYDMISYIYDMIWYMIYDMIWYDTMYI
jgi:hypothetical protein